MFLGARAALGRTAKRPRDEATRFEQVHSTEPVVAKAEDVHTFQDLTKAAVSHLAEGRQAPALHELDAAFRLYNAAPDHFNRTIPVDVLDACLFAARALLETGAPPQDVDAHLRKCRLLLPRSVEPRMIRHTLVAPAWTRVLHSMSAGGTVELPRFGGQI
jgi:hypothetical protein